MKKYESISTFTRHMPVIGRQSMQLASCKINSFGLLLNLIPSFETWTRYPAYGTPGDVIAFPMILSGWLRSSHITSRKLSKYPRLRRIFDVLLYVLFCLSEICWNNPFPYKGVRCKRKVLVLFYIGHVNQPLTIKWKCHEMQKTGNFSLLIQ